MTRLTREFAITITITERREEERTHISFKDTRRCSYVLARVKGEDEQRYLGPYLATELARLFGDTVVTLVADEAVK